MMTVTSQQFPFDDYYRLGKLDLAATRMLVFQGMSGSGKTTAIDYLCQHHDQFRERSVKTFRLVGPRIQLPALEDQLVVLDDVRFVRQLRPLWRLLRAGNTVLIASHLPPFYFLPWRLLWESRVFVMDQDEDKIERYLARSKVVTSRQAVRQYCRLFGANYLDVDFILERCPGSTFDEALAHFLKFCELDLSPDPLWS
ncbi:MAG: hypothetical protein GY888_17080 [Planctomycetaceae bacterium]|nr:hypothetical protein [Planctomycetaceae bacterium]